MGEVNHDVTLGGYLGAAIGKQADTLKVALEKTAESDDPEAVHDARTASRRLETFFSLFDRAERRGPERKAVRGLRRVVKRLGAVRDLDVLLDDAKGYAEKLGRLRKTGFDAYVETLHEKRRDALEKLRKKLSPETVQETLSIIQAAAEFALSRPEAKRPAGIDAPTALLAAYAELIASSRGALSADADQTACHEVRRAVKRLRYIMEAFQGLLGPAGESFAAHLKTLQDYLGKLNDSATVSTAAASWVSGRIEKEDGMIGGRDSFSETTRYLGTRRRRVEQGIGGFRSVWAKFATAAFRKRFFAMLQACPIDMTER